ncbi:hypothetical protein TGCAST_263642B, partial [Toxoplasma gondii CAST]
AANACISFAAKLARKRSKGDPRHCFQPLREIGRSRRKRRRRRRS